MSAKVDQARIDCREKRERLGLSLRDLRIITGIDQSTISRFERGGSVPDFETLVRIMAWLEQPLSDGAISIVPKDTLPAIRTVIANDPDLTPAAAEGLSELMETAYRVFTR